MNQKRPPNPMELLKDLVPGFGYVRPGIPEGIVALQPLAAELYAVHIRLEYPDESTWHKKAFYHIDRRDRSSRLDEWICKHLIDQKEYSAYLERYRPLVQSGQIRKDIDEYIMGRHYRPRALKQLHREKNIDTALWTKKRRLLVYERRSELHWKSGEEFGFDFRNPVESLYIHTRGGVRNVMGVGGSGSSGQRWNNTFFTALFHILGKKKPIPHHLFRYDGFNRLHYIGCRLRLKKRSCDSACNGNETMFLLFVAVRHS